MAELLKRLSEAHAVSGCETAAREIILDEIKGITDDITVDTMGNIIAFKKGRESGKTIAKCKVFAITANMDEAGAIISGITDKGYIKFKSVGDIDPRKLVSKKIITESGVKGVIGMKAIHLQTREERENVVKVKDLYIDIGARDKEDAKKRVSLGEYVTFLTDFDDLGENVKGKALGRSGACTALINALKGDYPYDFYAIFTVQHEVGSRGALITAHRINADVLLTVSAAESGDMIGCSGGMRLGEGVRVNLRDSRTIADKPLSDALLSLAKENGIRASARVTVPYFSDGGAAQITDTRVVSAVIPCRYALSPVSIMNKGDISETEKFIRLYLNKIGELI